jgi:DNA-binding FrmR family transcriptional regulator
LRRVEEDVLRDHISHCVAHAMASGDAAEQKQKIEELMDVLARSAR